MTTNTAKPIRIRNAADLAHVERDKLHRLQLIRADLREADLSGANLREADLSWANLSGANLREADLSWANLSGANLREADLSRAILSGANLSWANLSGANLREADLSWANLRGANLSRANLREADLRRANLRETGAVAIQSAPHHVWIVPGRMIIGCQSHTADEWRALTDEQIAAQGGTEAVEAWREHRAMLLALADRADRIAAERWPEAGEGEAGQ